MRKNNSGNVSPNTKDSLTWVFLSQCLKTDQGLKCLGEYLHKS